MVNRIKCPVTQDMLSLDYPWHAVGQILLSTGLILYCVQLCMQIDFFFNISVLDANSTIWSDASLSMSLPR